MTEKRAKEKVFLIRCECGHPLTMRNGDRLTRVDYGMEKVYSAVCPKCQSEYEGTEREIDNYNNFL